MSKTLPSIVREVGGKSPRLGARVFLADNAVVVGDVELGDDVSLWFGCVLRADVGWIRVGARSNIQDLSMVHMSLALSNAEVGEEVTVGHGVILHGARIGSGCLVGMGAILLDNAEIGEESVIAAGSLVTSNTKVPPRSLVRGSPARVIRELDPDEWGTGRKLAHRYLDVANQHRLTQPPPTK